MSVPKHAGDVTPPIAARPSQALLHEVGVVLQRGQDLGLFVVLVSDFLVVGHEPAGHEVVVVRVELIPAEPLFVGEAVLEGRVFDDAAAVGNGPSGEARQTAVHVHAGGAVEVPPLEVEGVEVAVNASLETGRLRTLQPLIGPHRAVAVILQRGQDPRQQLRRPEHVVVGKDRNGRADFGDRSNHLSPFVGICHAADSDLRRPHALDHGRRSLQIGIDRDQEDFKRLGDEDAADGVPQLGAGAFDRRDDDGDILRRQPRTVRDGDGPESAEGHQVHD